MLAALAGGVMVVAACFWSTRAILHYWSAPTDPNADVIHVVEATYGDNCQTFVTPDRYPNFAKPGNASAAVATVCNKTKASCLFTIDVTKLGDPANGCGKDFTVSWRCGSSTQLHQIYLPAEANKRIALLGCPQK
jgi:hypothetical protein